MNVLTFIVFILFSFYANRHGVLLYVWTAIYKSLKPNKDKDNVIFKIRRDKVFIFRPRDAMTKNVQQMETVYH